MSAIGYLALSIALALIAMPIGYRLAFRAPDSWQAAKDVSKSGQRLPPAAEDLGKGIWQIVGLGLMLFPGAAVLINVLVLVGVIIPVGE